MEMKVGLLVRPNGGWYGGDRSGYLGRVEALYESGNYGLCVLVNYGPNGPEQGSGRVEREWIPAVFVDILDGVTVMLLEQLGRVEV
jgi:hypothetical protein